MMRAARLLGLALALGLAACQPVQAGTTWNPSDKNAAITLSGSNLVATGSGSAFKSVRSTTSYTVGTNNKVVFTLTSTTWSGDGWIGGLGDAGFSLASYVGATANSWGQQIDAAGDHYATGVTGTTNACSNKSAAASGTHTYYFAVDFNTGKMWCSADNCTSWVTNPSDGTSQVTTLNSATAFFIAFAPLNGSNSATMNPTPDLSSCTGTTGFTTWDVSSTPGRPMTMGIAPWSIR